MGGDQRLGYAKFETTQWSAVFQAQAIESGVRRQALGDLIGRYYPALLAHLLRKQWVDYERASDLVQGFVADKLLEKRLVERAELGKGKFRSLLVRALENYAIDELRKGAHDQAVKDLDFEPSSEPSADAFDTAWARSMLEDTLTRMKATCLKKQQLATWEVFECRLLLPTRHGVEPLPYDELVRRFGFASPEQASNALVSAKRIFTRVFAEVAREYQAEDESSEDLVLHLLETLRKAGAIDWRSVALDHESIEPDPTVVKLDATSPDLLAEMIFVGPDARSLWNEAEYGAYMEHLMAQPVTSILQRSVGRDATVAVLDPTYTLADLFRDPTPKLECLCNVKKFARQQARQVDAAIPPDIASTIYFTSIAVARLRLLEKISNSNDEVLAWGCERALAANWLSPLVRGALEEGLVEWRASQARE